MDNIYYSYNIGIYSSNSWKILAMKYIYDRLHSLDLELSNDLQPLLLTWFNFNLSMDK